MEGEKPPPVKVRKVVGPADAVEARIDRLRKIWNDPKTVVELDELFPRK